MARFVGSVLALLSLALVGGCRSENREAPIQNVLNALETSVEKLKAIHTGLTEAVDQKAKLDEIGEAEARKEAKSNLKKKLSEVVNSIDDLKKQAEKLRDEMRRAEKIKTEATEEEKKELVKKFQPRLVTVLQSLETERLEVTKAWSAAKAALKADKEDEKMFKEVDLKFNEAESEFELLSRLR